MNTLTIRDAVPEDLNALVALEKRCFDLDRLSRRSFQHLLTHGHAFILVAEDGDRAMLGNAVVLLHRSTPLARLYSIAVAPEARGHRVGATLLQDPEGQALQLASSYMPIEDRPDAPPPYS
ncbi:MAG: GNAT family N-acetyltransferase, partial [Rhodospirillales bacterium]